MFAQNHPGQINRFDAILAKPMRHQAGLRQAMPSLQSECLVLVGDQAMSRKAPFTSDPILQMNSLAPALEVRDWVR
ncbi:hypothetical protein CN145_37015, partial [Sinorhizobium meliloti]